MEDEMAQMAVRPQDRPDAAVVHDNEDTEEEQIVASGGNSRKLPYVVVVVVPVGNNVAAGAVLANDGRLLPKVDLSRWCVVEVFDRTCTIPNEKMLLPLPHLLLRKQVARCCRQCCVTRWMIPKL
jgi:hypothetical protein